MAPRHTGRTGRNLLFEELGCDMQHYQVKSTDRFRVLGGTPRSQAAIMVLSGKETTGGPDNRHEDADQWLYVVSGEATAIIEGQEVALQSGQLLLIEQGEAHEIINRSEWPLVTFSIYAPPAYE